MTDLRVAVYPATEPDRYDGSAMYRLVWPSRALADQPGIQVLLDDAPTLNGVWRDVAGTPRLLGLAEVPDVDVVVLQRPLQSTLVDLIPHLQAEGVAVVVETDDAFDRIHPKSPAYDSAHPRNPDHNWRHLARACQQADLVTVTTPKLAAIYGKHGRAAVLPNYVPAWYLDVEAERDGRTVGWTGSVRTHRGDLEVTRGAVARACAETGAHVRVVGTGEGVQTALGLAAPVEACGWLPIDAYPKAMAVADVGIVPLVVNSFNSAKSWLKAAEYAACGVPVVMSPTGPNVALHELGAGRLAPRSRDWHAHLTALLRDPALRADEAARGRSVMADLTVEKQAWRWAEQWARAATNRAGAARAA